MAAVWSDRGRAARTIDAYGWGLSEFLVVCGREAVADGQAALDRLLERLTDVPTPAGPTPAQIGGPVTAARLPIVEITTSAQTRHPGT